MAKNPTKGLSRRERQIMELVYRLGKATVAEVRSQMPDPPGYSSVRAQLRILEDKGLLRHRQEGPRYVYQPVASRDKVRLSALKNLLRNFFDDSHEELVAALLDAPSTELSDGELKRLAAMIEKARKAGR